MSAGIDGNGGRGKVSLIKAVCYHILRCMRENKMDRPVAHGGQTGHTGRAFPPRERYGCCVTGGRVTSSRQLRQP